MELFVNGPTGRRDFFPFSLAIFMPGRVNPGFALLSIAAGTVATIGWKFVFPQGTDPLYAGLAASALVLCGSLFGPRQSRSDG